MTESIRSTFRGCIDLGGRDPVEEVVEAVVTAKARPLRRSPGWLRAQDLVSLPAVRRTGGARLTGGTLCASPGVWCGPARRLPSAPAPHTASACACDGSLGGANALGMRSAAIAAHSRSTA